MSKIIASSITGLSGAPTFTNGINVTGVITATTFSGSVTGSVTGNVTGNATGLTGSPNITVGVVTTTSLTVNGNSTVTGILSTSSVTDQTGGYLSTPPGTVISVASSTAPTGYLKANGAAISRSTYSTLFAGIGTVHGAGDGSSTFNIPDLRGEFIRGWADDRAVDTGRGFGSSQADDFKSHNHSYSSNGSGMAGRINPGISAGFSGNGIGDVSFSISNTGGTETRPRNIALLYCIKY